MQSGSMRLVKQACIIYYTFPCILCIYNGIPNHFLCYVASITFIPKLNNTAIAPFWSTTLHVIL